MIDEGAVIENSVIGLRCLIGRDVVIRNSILMGNDFYEAPGEFADDSSNGRPPLGIGAGHAHRRRHHRQELPHRPQRPHCQHPRASTRPKKTEYGMIRDGIAVVPKGAVLPDGWSI